MGAPSVSDVRILHTSDWHLGRSFHREGMLGHQGAWADHLLEVVESEGVDLVVVSGDVYDRALPPVDAVQLADDLLVRLAHSRARVVLTSGNHDSARRLGFNARLVDAAGVHVRTVADQVDVPVVLGDAHGPVAVYGVPYLEPDSLREPWGLPDRSHQAALGEAMRRVRNDLARRPAGTRSVVLAHAFVAGAEPSDSERDISVGGVSRVGVGTFDGVDYAALGHLHGRHTLTERVRYSGSPLAYSFSEAEHRKGAWLVDLDARGGVAAEFVDAPVPRPLARLRGDLDDLLRRRRAGRARAVVGAGHADRPGPSPPRDGASAAALRAHAGHRVRPARGRNAHDAGGAARPGPQRPRHRPRLRHRRPRARRRRRGGRAAAGGLRGLRPRRRGRSAGGLMRLHRLEVTAFGPFAGHESVDFDTLSDARLFLLAGPTGAGKSTVLDAVCFGLFGDVPGDRASAKRLRSDHAADGVRPEVRLEVTVRGRRLRLTRSPAWERPKKRGTGTTTEQAHVVLEERLGAPGSADHPWTTLTNRLDEAGQVVSEVLGLTITQFTQVAMLPQGRFQAFLRARSEERHAVLQHLFRTQRFADVERWLTQHRLDLAARDRQHQEAVADVVSRLCEAGTDALPAEWDLADLAAPAASGALERWAHRLETDAVTARREAEAARTVTEQAGTAARDAVASAQRTLDLQARHREATTAAASLAAVEQEALRSEERLDAARRAAPVLPLALLADRARLAAAAAAAQVGETVAAVTRLLDAGPAFDTAPTRTARSARPADAWDVAGLTALAERADALARAAKTLAPQEAQRRRAATDLAAADQRLAGLEAERSALEETAAQAPAALAAARAEVTVAEEAAAGLPLAERRVADATTTAAAVARVETLVRDVATARERFTEAREAAAGAREAWLHVRESRITGMAAELALALASGEDCPVCGSLEHPAPARHAGAAVTRESEATAQRAWGDAELARDAAADVLRAAESSLAGAREAAGGVTAQEALTALTEARAEVERTRAAEAVLTGARAGLAQLEQQVDRTGLRRIELAQQVVALSEQRAAALRTLDDVDAQLSETFGEQAGIALADLARTHRRLADAVNAARTALEARDRARDAVRAAEAEAGAGAGRAGFADVPSAVAAGLPEQAVRVAGAGPPGA